jgi:hypothetical protein
MDRAQGARIWMASELSTRSWLLYQYAIHPEMLALAASPQEKHGVTLFILGFEVSDT